MNSNDCTQSAECRLAVEHLLDYLEEPGQRRDALDSAIAHMQNCPYCESSIEYLIRALTTDEEDRLTCSECQASLPAYLQAELEGRAHDEDWEPIVGHLEICPYCAAVYASLSDLVALAYGERGEPPTHYPEPDLSFLRTESTAEREEDDLTWRLDDLGHLLIQLAEGTIRALEQPAPRPAYAGVKSAEARRTLGQFSLEEAVEDLALTLKVEESRDKAERCTVIITVDIPSQGGWPNLAGTRVTLKRGEKELATRWTDAFGTAVFESVQKADLAHLTFEIAPQRET